MKTNYADTIRYLMENFDKTKYSRDDLRALQETLNLLKVQVKMNIVQECVQDKQSLLEKINNAMETLNARKQELETQKKEKTSTQEYPEELSFEALDSGVSRELQLQVRKTKREEYQSKKEQWETNEAKRAEMAGKRIDGEIARIDELRATLDNPQMFIQRIFMDYTKETNSRIQRSYQYLMNKCASSMAYGWGQVMETSRTTTKVPLFKRNSSGDYSPNPEAISEFLDMIRDEDAVYHVSAYNEAKEQQAQSVKRLNEARETVTKLEETKRVLRNDDLTSKMDSFLAEVIETTRKRDSAKEELRNMQLPTKTNRFQQFFNRILGKTRKKDERISQLQNEVFNCDRGLRQMDKILGDKIEENPEFGTLFKAYIGAADYLPALDSEQNNKGIQPLNSRSSVTSPLIQRLAKSVYDKEGMSAVVRRQFFQYGEDELSEARKKQDEAEFKVEDASRKADNLFEGLSDKEKEMAKKGIDMRDILDRFIKQNPGTKGRGTISPYISSFILEALMNANNIRTFEDAEKLGISITDKDKESVQNAEDKMTLQIDRRLDTILQKTRSDEGERD